MTKKRHPFGIVLAVLGTLGMTTMSAQACEEMMAISYLGSEEGELTIRINDAIAVRGESSSSFGMTLPQLLLEGDNSLTVELVAKDGSPTAHVEIFQACAGEFPGAPGENPNVLAEVKLTAPWTETTHFSLEGLPNYAYLSADRTDDEGLLEAVKDVHLAVQKGDVDAYMGYLKPMLADMAIRGRPSPDFVHAMVVDLLGGDYEVADLADLTVAPVIGGRAYQVQSAEGDGPLVFTSKSEKDFTKVSQASIWIKTPDGWKILRQ